MDEVLEFLKANPTYYLATVDANGDPQLRPFGTITKHEGKLIIQTGNVKNCFKQMVEHPRVAICTMSKDGIWLRISADAVVLDDMAARQAALDDHPNLKAMYAADDGNCEVLALENATATFCSFTAAPRTVTF